MYSSSDGRELRSFMVCHSHTHSALFGKPLFYRSIYISYLDTDSSSVLVNENLNIVLCVPAASSNSIAQHL